MSNMATVPWVCTTCWDESEARRGCLVCGGRGVIESVPWADRKRDEVIPGLWIGGHVCQPKGAPPDGLCYIEPGEFDLVVSLFHHDCGERCVEHESLDPPEGMRHLEYLMEDEDLDPEHHTGLDEVVDEIKTAVHEERKVLVRCFAGLNRSSLVVGLTLIRLGWYPEVAIAHIRNRRSPYALCNADFVYYLLEQDT